MILPWCRDFTGVGGQATVQASGSLGIACDSAADSLSASPGKAIDVWKLPQFRQQKSER